MWKNSLLYVHDPVNQFHSEENDHHCVVYTKLRTILFPSSMEQGRFLKQIQRGGSSNSKNLVLDKYLVFLSQFFQLCSILQTWNNPHICTIIIDARVYNLANPKKICLTIFLVCSHCSPPFLGFKFFFQTVRW